MAEAVVRARAEVRRGSPVAADYDIALAEELARLLATRPRSGSELALAVRRRKEHVLTTLAAAPHFIAVGRGRSIRWHLRGTGREPQSDHATTDPDSEPASKLEGP